jgi:hypothetical protein
MSNLKFRIVLEDQLLPVQAFFNAIPDVEFMKVLGLLAGGAGVDYNGVGYVLPGEDDESAPASGALFYVGTESVEVSNDDLLKYVQMSLDAYVASRPLDRSAAEALTEKLRFRLG